MEHEIHKTLQKKEPKLVNLLITELEINPNCADCPDNTSALTVLIQEHTRTH